MCDTIKQKNIPDSQKPQYVYKILQRVSPGKYVTCVMGETLQKGTWKRAPKIKQKGLDPVKLSSSLRGLIDILSDKNLLKFPKLDAWNTGSSSFEIHHDGRWAAFKTEKAAKQSSMNLNFSGKRVVVKCEVRGIVDRSSNSGDTTYLAELIKVVEEV